MFEYRVTEHRSEFAVALETIETVPKSLPRKQIINLVLI